jgi:fucose 4-O-acetylase-like acetyltransferase
MNMQWSQLEEMKMSLEQDTNRDTAQVEFQPSAALKGKGRMMEVDFAKGVLIILMVFGHMSFYGSTKGTMQHLVDWVYAFHMAVFFFLSGFFFTVRDPWQTLKRLVLRLFVPYCIFLILYGVGLHFAGRYGVQTAGSLDSLDVLSLVQLVLIKPMGGFWFVHNLLAFQFIFILATVLAQWLKVVPAFAAGMGLLGVACLLFEALTPWGIGFLLLGQFWRVVSWPLLTKPLLGLGAVVLFLVTDVGWYWEYWPLRVLLALCVLAALLYAGQRYVHTAVVQGMVYVGQRTLPILLLHPYFIGVSKFMGPKSLALDPSGFSYALATLGLTIVSILLGYELVIRWKVGRFLFGLPLQAPSSVG